jgi:hypothetical protein
MDIMLCHRTGALANDTRITEERTIPPYIIDRRCTERGKRKKRKGGKGGTTRDEKAGNVAFEDVLRCKDGWMDVGSCGSDSQMMDMIRVIDWWPRIYTSQPKK